ncbi:MAG: hypothetical protein ABIP56_09480 [Dokdonella sp.]
MRARHDADDLRRLAELGIVALDWRHLPARRSHAVIIDSGESATAILSFVVKGLAIVGISARLHGLDASSAGSADAVVIRFGAAGMATSPNADNALALPPLAELCGNAAAKRQAWSQMRALLRR